MPAAVAPTGVVAALAALAVLGPLGLALAMLAPAARGWAVRLAPFAAWPALVLAAASAGEWVIEIPWIMLGARVGLDATGSAFLLLSSITWVAAGATAAATMGTDAHRHRFVVFFLLSMTGSLGLALARDAVTFYLCFALMSLSAYGLVAHDGTAGATRAGRAYIVFALLGEILLVSGLFFAVSAAGTTSFDTLRSRMVLDRAVVPAITLILLGCAIKAGAVPLHLWLPGSYARAPLAATVALAGTMSKAGVLGWIRLLPTGEIALNDWGAPMTLAGLAALFYGVAAGLPQRDARTALAYSSVSQMGFMTAGMGLALVAPAAAPALLVAVMGYALHHGLAKGALFLSVGALGARPGPRARAAIWAGFAGVGLSLAGAPFTSGAAAKAALKDGVAATGLASATGLITVLSLAAVGTTLLVARVAWLAWHGAVAPADQRAGAAPALVWPWGFAVGASLFAPWALMRPLVSPDVALSAAGLGWIAAGLAGAGAVAWLSRAGRWPWLPDVPAGDLLAPLERLGRAVWQRIDPGHAASDHADEPPEPVPPPMGDAAVPGLERALLRWPVFGLAVVLVMALIVILLASQSR